MLGYWKRVFVRAFVDTIRVFGSNTRRFIVGGMLTAIAAGLLYYFHDQAQGLSKMEWWVWLVAAYAIVFPIVFVFVFLRTPYVLEQEMNTALGGASTSAAEEQRRAKQAIDQLTRERDDAKNADPKKRIIRSELIQRKEGFERLRSGIEREDAKAIHAFLTYDWQAYNYVVQHVPGYTSYANKFAAVNSHTQKIKYTPQEFQHHLAWCDDRIQQFNELIDAFS